VKAIPIHISFTRVVASQFSAITRVAAIGVISGLKRTDVAAAIRLCINAPNFELIDSSVLNRGESSVDGLGYSESFCPVEKISIYHPGS